MQIHITLVMIMFILVVTAYVKPFGGEQSEPLLLLELGSLCVTFLALWSGSIFNDYPKCQDPLQGEGVTLPWCDALSLIVGALIILYIIVVIVYFVRFKCQCCLCGGNQEIPTDNPLQDINLVIIADGRGEGGGEGGGGGSTQGEDSYSTSRTTDTELTPIASGTHNPTLDSGSRTKTVGSTEEKNDELVSSSPSSSSSSGSKPKKKRRLSSRELMREQGTLPVGDVELTAISISNSPGGGNKKKSKGQKKRTKRMSKIMKARRDSNNSTTTSITLSTAAEVEMKVTEMHTNPMEKNESSTGTDTQQSM